MSSYRFSTALVVVLLVASYILLLRIPGANPQSSSELADSSVYFASNDGRAAIVTTSATPVDGTVLDRGTGTAELSGVSEVVTVAEQAYPPPPYVTASPPTPGSLHDLDAATVAGRIVERWEEKGWTSGETTIIAAVDVFAKDAARLRVRPDGIAYGGEPDIAIILQGSFQVNLPGLNRASRPSEFARVVVDKTTGLDYAIQLSNNLDRLINELPQ